MQCEQSSEFWPSASDDESLKTRLVVTPEHSCNELGTKSQPQSAMERTRSGAFIKKAKSIKLVGGSWGDGMCSDTGAKQGLDRLVQSDLGRHLFPGSKTPVAPSPNHFREFPMFRPSTSTFGSQPF